MEGIHKMPTVGKKSRGRKFNTQRNNVMMDMFRSEHIKNSQITE